MRKKQHRKKVKAQMGSPLTSHSNLNLHSVESPKKLFVIKCPECGSESIYKSGFRHLRRGGEQPIQRFLCRTCEYRFSFGPKNSKTSQPNKNCECAQGFKSPTKNLQALTALKELEKTPTMEAGANKPDVATMKGLLLQFTFYLHKEGYAKDSRYIDCIRMLKNSNANLLDPENVKEIIANKKWKPGVKMQAVYAYDAMTKMLNITWKKPRYRQEETLPFVPIEKEIDQLIAGCKGRKLVAFLQTLKETFADPGEALKLRWKDIRENVITINQPVRGHNPRQLKVSHKLIAMLNALPKTSEYIFNTTYASLSQCFRRVRKRSSSVLQNPRIQEITFTSFRHWGASMVLHQTKSILLVKKLLGHKHLKNTMKYTHLIDYEGDDYDVATATTIEEAKKVITAGFEYVTELKGVKIFRKPKRFNA